MNNKSLLLGIAFLGLWILLIWYGFNQYAPGSDIVPFIRDLSGDEKIRLCIWLTASITALALALRYLAEHFIGKKKRGDLK